MSHNYSTHKAVDCLQIHGAISTDPTTKGQDPWFVDDKWIAHQIGMKPATIRVQRFKRAHGEVHWFTVDPIYIGTSPRYVQRDVECWLMEQMSKPISSLPVEHS